MLSNIYFRKKGTRTSTVDLTTTDCLEAEKGSTDQTVDPLLLLLAAVVSPRTELSTWHRQSMTAWLKGKLAGSASSPAISRLDRPPFLNSRFQLTAYWFTTRSLTFCSHGRAARTPSRHSVRATATGTGAAAAAQDAAAATGEPRERGRLAQQPKAERLAPNVHPEGASLKRCRTVGLGFVRGAAGGIIGLGQRHRRLIIRCSGDH